MMAIKMSGICLPPIVRAKTSLGLGHGTVVDIRSVMYDSRKQLKMKVSLRRKIHIMALPQETFLKARWSEDQSAAMPRKPAIRAGDSAVSVSAVSAIGLSLVEQPATDVDEIVGPARQQTEQDQPDQQQEMPVDSAEFHAQAHPDHLSATPHLGSRSAEGHQAAH